MPYESRLSLTVDSRSGERSLKRFRSELNDVERGGKSASRSTDQFSSSLSGVRTMALAAGGALSAIGLIQLTRGVFDTVRSTEKLQASLRTVTGSTDQATAAWNELTEFAKTTPFTLDQSVNGFIRMKSLGLDPTTESLNSFGNTASAMGKDLMQMIEAVADASTGEFERLKEFGIRAKTEGDNIRFIFQGTETTVANSAEAITGYLEEIGNTEFSEAMALQVDTVGGQVSNLEDQVDALYRAIGDAGATDAFKDSISSASDIVEGLTENLDRAAAAAAGISVATTAYFALANATTIATTAQLAFNAAARVNPYVFIASTIAGATAAVWAFTSAQESALEVWERAGDSEAAYSAALSNVAAENRIQEIVRERADLQNQLNEAQGRWIRNGTEEESIKARLADLEREYHAITDARIAAERAQEERRKDAVEREAERKRQQMGLDAKMAEAKAEAARKSAEVEKQAALASAQAWNDARSSAYESFQSVLDTIDPVGAELRKLTSDIAVVQEAFARGFIDSDQADAIVNALNEAAEESREKGEQSGDNFSRGFESQVDRVADSLQNSITSGDWAGIGATIGASLASGVAQVVGDQVSGSLGAGIASAIGGPIVGAIAGGVVGLAAEKIADYFSDDWDPTEMRQAAQGTGTVLGDMNAKSESIRRAVEGSESGIGQLVGINQNMLRALQTLQLGISGAASMVGRDFSGMTFSGNDRFAQNDLAASGLLLGSTTMGAGTLGAIGGISGAFGPVGSLLNDALGGIVNDTVSFLDDLTGGLLSDIGGAVFGGKQEVKDIGIQIFGATLDEMIRGFRDSDRYLTAQAFATIEEDGGLFGSDDRFDRFERLSKEASGQISLVFEGIQDSVVAGAEALGLSGGRIQAALNQFTVETQKISLEDLSAEEQAAEMSAVFSSIFDQAAGAVVPYLDEFQRAGEGLGETLARVANQTLVTEEAVNRLGIQFSDLAGRELVVASERLMEAAGGVEQFISSMEGFIDNFATDAQQFELAQSDITRALGQANLQLPATRDGYYDLLQAQNGATASGADNIATLLRLQGVADEYYTFLEDAQQDLQRSAIESQRDMLSVQQGVYRDALQEAEAMAGSVSRALDGLSVDGQQFQAASRDRALASLERMATTGNIGSQTALNESLAAATNISAGEFGSLNDYIRTVARTGATLTNLQKVTDKQVSREQQLLSNIERRLEAMTDELSAVGRQSAKNTAKTAKILERIELDGLEVRE